MEEKRYLQIKYLGQRRGNYMIRIKFLYNVEDFAQALTDRSICIYDSSCFINLVNGSIAEENKVPPFRDEDSARFIHEIDHAEFVEDDWYSIITPYNRTCLTALCGGTQYALTVINNSRYGIYTSYDGYGNDIWNRLADLSIDVLIYIRTDKLNVSFPALPFAFGFDETALIENYRYEGNEIEVYVDKPLTNHGVVEKDGKFYVDNCFEEFCFSWQRDFDKLLKWAEKALEHEMYSHKPIISNYQDFIATLDSYAANAFLYDWDDEDETIMWLSSLQFHNYMKYVPVTAQVKYPMYLVMKKNKQTQQCVASNKCGFKYPTFSEALIIDFMRLPDEEKDAYELLVVIIDSEAFQSGADTLKNVLWAFRFYDNIIELYDDTNIYKVFIDFIKQPFEDGLVTFEEGK